MAAGDRIVVPAMAAGFYSALGSIEKGAGDTLVLPEAMVNIGGNGLGFTLPSAVDWDPAANDDGTVAMALGDDVYIYAVQDASGQAVWVASANATYPAGSSAAESRKIGGFHVGRVREIADRYNKAISLAEQIVPNSCWDLRNRPACPDPTGMVQVGDIWVDIYLSSGDGGAWPVTVAQSRFGQTPLTGTEGYSYYDFYRLARNAGKRLPTYGEFLQFAYGSPEGATGAGARIATGGVGWDPTPNPYWMVSCENVDQPSGNIWQVLDEYSDIRNDTNTYAWATVDAGIASGSEAQGAVYHQGLKQLIAGGYWSYGGLAGPRCAYCTSAPWAVSTSTGGRCVSDSLKSVN